MINKTDTDWIDKVTFNADGLVPAIAQDAASSTVLMMAWMNRESLIATRDTGEAVYWSRSRNRLWKKGESSGHIQRVKEIRLDCDGDTLILSVEQIGGIACHTGQAHCFYRRLDDGAWHDVEAVLRHPDDEIIPMTGESDVTKDDVLERLARTLESRKSADSDSSYTASLYAGGLDLILRKIGEEAVETILAAKGNDKHQVVYETADLWFHSLVMLAHLDLGPADVLKELDRRFGTSGHEEKASRT